MRDISELVQRRFVQFIRGISNNNVDKWPTISIEPKNAVAAETSTPTTV